MNDRINETIQQVSTTAQRVVSDASRNIENFVNPPPPQSDFSKAANDAMEYLGEMLKKGAEMATTAFNGAVEMGKDAYEYIAHNAPNGRGGDGPRNTR